MTRRAGLLVLRVLVAVAALLTTALPALAHELRPAYLQLQEVHEGEFTVLWKTPMLGDARLALEPEISGSSVPTSPATTRTPPGAAIREWTLYAPGLRGRTIGIRGLDGTSTDALVVVEFADGSRWTQRLTPSAPAAEVPLRPSFLAVAGVYFRLGVEHLLTGADHLLFVLALMLLSRNGWALVRTVSAFTLSHSVTLTAATLGWVDVPAAPVEAVIALSIVFAAAEVVHARRGRPGLAARAPWVIAFTFGLLHGLGFAGGLHDAGLPEGQVPAALLFFSAGVETGHLLFVGGALGVSAVARRVVARIPRRAGSARTAVWRPYVLPYSIGGVAAFWLVERVAAL